MARILVVEKELQLRRFLKRHLSSRGFKVSEVEDSALGIERIRNLHPYLTLIDLDSFEEDDSATVGMFRSGSSAPIICMVGKNKIAEIASILESGADDCIMKPFGIRELISRIEIALCQAMRVYPRTVFTAGEVVFDPIQGTVSVGNTMKRLQPAEYTVLRSLVRHAGEVVPYERLLCELDGPEGHTDRNRLRVYISKIRDILAGDPHQEDLLVTVQGVGYRFRRRN